MCIDEQTGIQALQRIAVDLPVRPGLIRRREYEYTRHGTTCLFGNFDVVSGKILARSLPEHRGESDFLANVKNLMMLDRLAGRILAGRLAT